VPLNKALTLLENAALRLDSQVLSTLAVKGREQGVDNFVKVRSIIKDFIAKLKGDAESEAETKSFCDKEMSTQIKARDAQNLAIEKYTAKITRLGTQIKVLSSEINELSAQTSELYKALNEATELRQAEKASNMRTIADAEAGMGSTRFALSTLRDFYGGSLLQRSGRYTPPNSDRDGNTVGDLAPEQLDGEYHGKQSESKGIIGLLEIIISDFERTVETTTSTEKQAQSEFEAFKGQAESDISKKKQAVKEKEGKVADTSDELADTKDSHKEAKSKLTLALSELEELKGMCVAKPDDWAARNKKRMEEIESLKEALKILDEWHG